MPRKKYDLEFAPQKKRRMSQVGHFMLGFLSILLLLGVLSAIALQRDGLLDQIFGQYINPTDPTTEEAPSDAWNYSGKAVFLLSGADDSGKALHFVMLLRMDLQTRRLGVFPLDPAAQAPLDGKALSLEQAYAQGGVKQLKAAAEALTQDKIDRCVNSRENGFVKAVNTMGSVTVEVEKRIQYRSAAFSLTLAQGQQRLQGDALLRYFRYLRTLGESGPARQAELMRRVLESFLTAKNAATPELMQNYFDTLVNLVETDISVVDFAVQREILAALLTQGHPLTIEVRE
ncbi:MAG: LCP family protein [Oscillospiraceae bacterium]|jgi:LCP family protein required for cell wall assembly|nr:LCP family protein [Oscillospiraceae bacterium]